MDQSNHQFLTVEEAEQLTGYSRSTLDRYAAHGRLTKYFRGMRRRVFFEKNELETLMENLRRIQPEK